MTETALNNYARACFELQAYRAIEDGYTESRNGELVDQEKAALTALSTTSADTVATIARKAVVLTALIAEDTWPGFHAPLAASIAADLNRLA